MEAQLKEIEGLLESTTVETPRESTSDKIKKYVKLVLPHVALVAVVCLYALIGAYIFYSLESPNEDFLKVKGRNTIETIKRGLVESVQTRNTRKDSWRSQAELRLFELNRNIYKAFKEQYVRYPDVRWDGLIEDEDDRKRVKRHRNTKTRSDKGEKLWTASSALFFAATTMATIGYGNIVPVTSSGRIACVVFALFGAPLAIITIGDLGKFLSECTIWLYKQMKKGRQWTSAHWRRLRHGKDRDVESVSSSTASSSERDELDWEDLVMDKTEVPVLLVFFILLLYIAFGGILFSFLENWSYMDAFYYSFISLTTIGFGDIVPENHDYIVIMLIYLGVGLAVTTMCIDLVGIQYIQKIHYFGRKFRGTDLLHLLKRKRMIERRLAMGQGEEILQMYMQQMQQLEQPSPVPEAVVVESRYEDEKSSVQSSWPIDDALLTQRVPMDWTIKELLPAQPELVSVHSYRPASVYSNSSASARSMMFSRLRSRGGSMAESGPALSEHCSLSTEPSVHIRTAYWDNFRSPDPSLQSFQFTFPPPSPDYHAIAMEARASRRLHSLPSTSYDPPPSPIGMACMEDWDSYIRMLEEYRQPYAGPLPEEESSSESEAGAHLDIDLGAFELVDSGLSADTLLSSDEPVIFHNDMPVHSVHHDTVQTEAALENLMNAPDSMLSESVPPAMVDDNYCFVVDGDKIRMGDIMGDDQWWRHTSRPTKYFYSDDLRKFQRVNCITAKGKVISAKLVAGAGLTVGGPDRSAPSTSSTPRSSISGSSSKQRDAKIPLAHVYKVIRFYSFWKTCTSFHRIVTMIDRVGGDDRTANPHFKKRLFVQYLWRNAKAVEKARVQKEFDPRRQRLLRFVTDPGTRKKMFK